MTDQSAAQIGLILDPNLADMHLTIKKGEKVMAGIVLSADQLDDTIAGLIQVRNRMVPAFPSKLENGTPVRDIKGLHYDFQLDAEKQELIFSVEDKTLSWLSFRFGVRLLERMLTVVNAAKNPHTGTP